MTLKSRTIIMALIVMIVLTPLIATVVVRSWQVRQDTKVALEDLYPAIIEASRMEYHVATMDRGLYAYVMTGDRAALQPFIAGQADASSSLSNLKGDISVASQQVQDDWQRLDNAYERWLNSVALPTITQMDQGNVDTARSIYGNDANQITLELLNQASTALDETIQEETVDAAISLVKLTRQLTVWLIVVTVALIILALIMIVVVRHQILRPLTRLRTQISTLVRTNDLSTGITPSGPPEIYDVAASADALRQHLSSQLLETQSALESVAQESPAVHQLHTMLAPPREPHVHGCALHVSAVAHQGLISGDWWTVVPMRPGVDAVLVCDTAGHDIAAGVTAVRFKATLETALTSDSGLRGALQYAAGLFATDTSRFVSCVIVECGPTARWINAGQEPPLLLTATGDQIWLEPTGPIVSALGGNWRVDEYEWQPGDMIIIATDGVFEAKNEQGNEVGREQFAAWCHELRDLNPHWDASTITSYLAENLMDKVRSYAFSPRLDDITIAVIYKLPTS